MSAGNFRRRITSLRDPGRHHESGSAVVEFVMVGTIVTFLLLAIFQFAYALYVRNTLIDVAAAGARVGALADMTLARGEEHARVLLNNTLGNKIFTSASSEKIAVGGVLFVKLKITARLPIVGPWGPEGMLVAIGQAVAE